MARDLERTPRVRWKRLRGGHTAGWTHRFRPPHGQTQVLPAEGSVVRTGIIMGGAILAVSLLNLLPLPASLQQSTIVNGIFAGLGALAGAITGRPRKAIPPPQ
jgi:hypothetical protein